MSVYYDSSRRQWRYDFVRNKERHSGYCIDPDNGNVAATKKAAAEIETKIKAGVFSHPQAIRNVATFTFAQALAAYAQRVQGGRNWHKQSQQIDDLLNFFGADTPITEITDERVWQYIEASRKTPVYRYMGGRRKLSSLNENELKSAWKALDRCRDDPTINRYLAVLKKALKISTKIKNAATGRSVLPAMPEIPMLRETDRLANPVPVDVIFELLRSLPPTVADAVSLMALTGMRKGEMMLRKVHDYRPDLRVLKIPGHETKGRRDEAIPLSGEAETIVQRRVAAATAVGSEWLFFRLVPTRLSDGSTEMRPERVNDFKRAWSTALKRLGITGYRIHDLKATFVTAVPAEMRQEMARHKSPLTTKRYTAVADDRKFAAAQNVAVQMAGFASIRKGTGDNVVQVPHKIPTQLGAELGKKTVSD